VVKQTRNKKYLEYLVSWKGQPNSKAVWMTAEQIQKHGADLDTLISSGLEISSFGEYGAGAPAHDQDIGPHDQDIGPHDDIHDQDIG